MMKTIRKEAKHLKHDFAAGASASLNKTITTMEDFLERSQNRPGRGLRDYLFAQLGDLAVKWYRYGFNRGHKESDKQSRNGRIPRTLRYDATREFFIRDTRTIGLKSKLKRKQPKTQRTLGSDLGLRSSRFRRPKATKRAGSHDG